MRICLLGEYNGNLDEGMRKSFYYITNELSKRHDLLPLDVRKVTAKSFWRNLKTFNPQIVHFFPGATIKSFLLLKIISLYCHDAKTVISILQPYFTISRHLISFIRPDLTLVQSERMEEFFNGMNCKTEFLPLGGVDVERFNPKLKESKNELREKYGVDTDKFVVLHVGSIKKGRNVLVLKKLQERNNNQVIIVGAVSQGIHHEILHKLEKAGCRVWRKYFERVEEVYALSDCYVFPTILKNDSMGNATADSIEMPLSVLEAMACNLPVISTRFGALPRLFDGEAGLFFVDGEPDFAGALENIKCGEIAINTREKVLPYSWEAIGKKLEEYYAGLIGTSDEN